MDFMGGTRVLPSSVRNATAKIQVDAWIRIFSGIRGRTIRDVDSHAR
jgi:hypothetical protein